MKRFLALILVLVMVFCLAACGESDPAGTTTPSTPNQPGSSGGNLPANPVTMGISVADVSGLLELIAGAKPSSEIKDLFLQVTAGEANGVLSLGATMLNKNYTADLFFGEALVLSAPALLDKNYGATMESLMSMLEGMTGAAVPSAPAGSVAGMLGSVDPEAVAGLLSKYYNLLLDELKKAEGITVTTEGGKTVITGTLNADACATVVCNLVDALCADDEFFTLMGNISGQGEAFKTDFLEGYPGPGGLLADAKEAMNKFAVSLKLNSLTLNDKNLPVAADLYFSLNQEVETDEIRLAEVALAFDLEKGTLSGCFKDEGTELASIAIGDGKLDAAVNIDGEKIKVHMEATDNSLTGYVEMREEKIAELALTFSETEIKLKLNISREEYLLVINMSDTAVSGSFSMGGQVMGSLAFDKKVEGSKTTLTLKTLEISSTTVDFSKLGICVYIDTNATLPSAPTGYTDITTLTEDELNAVLDKFLTDNQDLVDMLSSLFGGASKGEESTTASNVVQSSAA